MVADAPDRDSELNCTVLCKSTKRLTENQNENTSSYKIQTA